MIVDFQPGDFDRVGERHVLQKFEGYFVRSVFEAGVTLTVPSDIWRSFLANRQGRGAPDFAALLVAHIEGFTRPVADRIVRPGSELILLTIDRPCIAAALDGHLEAEIRVRDYVDPRRRSPLPLPQNRHIFPTVGGEAAQAVEKFELRERRRSCS